MSNNMPSTFLVLGLLVVGIACGNGQKITLWMNGRSVELDMHTRRSVKIGGAVPSEDTDTGASEPAEGLNIGASPPTEDSRTGSSEPEENEEEEEDRRTLYLADSMCESCDKLSPVSRQKCRKQLCDEENTVEKDIVIS